MDEVKCCVDCGKVLTKDNSILGLQCSDCYYAIEESSDLTYYYSKLED